MLPTCWSHSLQITFQLLSPSLPCFSYFHHHGILFLCYFDFSCYSILIAINICTADFIVIWLIYSALISSHLLFHHRVNFSCKFHCRFHFICYLWMAQSALSLVSLNLVSGKRQLNKPPLQFSLELPPSCRFHYICYFRIHCRDYINCFLPTTISIHFLFLEEISFEFAFIIDSFSWYFHHRFHFICSFHFSCYFYCTFHFGYYFHYTLHFSFHLHHKYRFHFQSLFSLQIIWVAAFTKDLSCLVFLS